MYYATAKEMEKLDALAVAGGLDIRQMMEIAGWHMVGLLKNMRIPKGARVVIVVGKGNKGGDGLSAARHLANYGWRVSVIVVSSTMSVDAQHHLALVKKMKIPVVLFPKHKNAARALIKGAGVLIDALLGYHLDGPPYGVFKEAILLMNASGKKIIAYDLPSGIDATSGECLEPCIRSTATLSLALPKRAFTVRSARAKSGDIVLADIGIPAFLYDRIAFGVRPPFDSRTGLVDV